VPAGHRPLGGGGDPRAAASHEFAWSGGVATAEDGDTLTTVLARADADLYRQKRSGRGV
jgi:PleD family two-component response regulator